MAKFPLLSAATLVLLAVAAAGARVLPDDNVDADVVERSLKEKNADATAPVVCSEELDANCPPNSTCCPKYKKSSSLGGDGRLLSTNEIVGYSCLVSWSSRAPQGPCCDDDDAAVDSRFGSGCAAGYTCAAPIPSATFKPRPFLQNIEIGDLGSSLASVPHCQRDDSAHPVDNRGHAIENEYERMPRYKTCPAFALEDIATPYGLPIPMKAFTDHEGANEGRRITKQGGEKQKIELEKVAGQLAYFTNMGPLASPSHDNVRTAVVGIHGSGRDAGSYLCAVMAALPEEGMEEDKHDVNFETSITSNLRHRRGHGRAEKEGGEVTNAETAASAMNNLNPDEILAIAPWFLAPSDGTPESSFPLPFLQWVDDAPVSHTFRYGAESIPVPVNDENGEASSATISSYGAMDVLLENLCDRANYPNLEHIVVVGHSAGGQFVHRWGLSSDSWCFSDDNGGKDDLPSVRLVAANPRSYAYLDERRYLPATESVESVASLEEGGSEKTATLTPFDELEFRPPTSSEYDDCQEYNRFCWGLEDNPDLPAPYISDNVDKLSTTNQGDGLGDHEGNVNRDVFLQYASRDVVYLSGERDTKALGDQICHEDGYQGPTRRERSERFYASLQVLGGDASHLCRRGEEDARLDAGGEVEEFASEGSRYQGGLCARHGEDRTMRVHDRLVVRNVGHDHALIFQSAEGREGMFSA